MNLSWREAIQKVLAQSAEPMHYVDIADAITAQNSRDVGANPAGLVNSTLAGLIGKESNDFVRIGRGYYWLRSSVEAQSAPPTATVQQDSGDVKEAGLINALGMYWSRENVNWMTTPRILGRQQIESRSVDFCGQRGVYLLHDGRAVVYVGRALERALGVRLREHTADRLNGRWDRFSWFGVYPIDDDGRLKVDATAAFDLNSLIATMEALLIEGLEPPQNRKRGDDFRAVEFLQVKDPDIQKAHTLSLLDELKKSFVERFTGG